MSQLAGHANRATVRLHDGFGDGQAHAGALDQIALILPAVKLVKNQAHFQLINARSAIRHGGGQQISRHLGADGDGPVSG